MFCNRGLCTVKDVKFYNQSSIKNNELGLSELMADLCLKIMIFQDHKKLFYTMETKDRGHSPNSVSTVIRMKQN